MCILLALTLAAPANAQEATLMPSSESILVLAGAESSAYGADAAEDAEALLAGGVQIAFAQPTQAWLLKAEGLTLVSMDAEGREVRRWTDLDAAAHLNAMARLAPVVVASR